MVQLIDKDAVMAEIEKYISNYKEILNKVDKSSDDWVDTIVSLESKIDVLQHILSFLDTLEVKEVDLEKYYHDFLQKEWFDGNHARTVSGMMFFTAKHFYELGLKASNPTTTAGQESKWNESSIKPPFTITMDGNKYSKPMLCYDKFGNYCIAQYVRLQTGYCGWYDGEEEVSVTQWKELTNGSISTEYGTQLNYIQKHWHESEYYLQKKQGEQRSAEWHKGDEQNLNACLGYIPDEYLRRWLMDVIHVKYDKPTDKVETKFHKGQWIVWQDECYKVNYNGCGYELVDKNGLSILLDYGTIDENAHLWDVAKDAKNGDVLVDGDNNIGIYKEIEGICWHSYFYLGCNNHLYGFSIGGSHVQNNTKPATKEQRDTLFVKMKEAGYMWDGEKKELKKENKL